MIPNLTTLIRMSTLCYLHAFFFFIVFFFATLLEYLVCVPPWIRCLPSLHAAQSSNGKRSCCLCLLLLVLTQYLWCLMHFPCSRVLSIGSISLEHSRKHPTTLCKPTGYRTGHLSAIPYHPNLKRKPFSIDQTQKHNNSSSQPDFLIDFLLFPFLLSVA